MFWGQALIEFRRTNKARSWPNFARLALKNRFKECLCDIARRKPESTFDNITRDFGVRYVEGYTSPNFADVVANAPFFRIEERS